MRVEVQRIRDKRQVQRLADALQKGSTARMGTLIVKPVSYRIFSDSVEFTYNVLGNIGADGYRRDRMH